MTQAAKLQQQPKIVPIKAGVYGPQGSGKSTSAALIAAAISAQFCNRAPVFVVDPEAAWPFLKRRIFDIEGIDLILKPYRSFKSLHDSIKEAERLGACAWIADPITLHWNELMQTYQGRKGFVAIDQWGDIRKVWGEYVTDFLNSPLTCIAAGRLGNDFEDREEEDSKGVVRTKTVKVGTKFKAGGGESFGYEPHLLLEMSLERKAKRVKGQDHEGEGRMIHRVDVLKDRTWALNGLVMRWGDKARYEKGGYRQVWDSIKPHFTEVQATLGQGQVGSDTSDSLITTDEGKSDFYRKQRRQEIALEEIKGSLGCVWTAATGKDAAVKTEVIYALFETHSWTAVERMDPEALEYGARVCVRMKNLALTKMPENREALLALVQQAKDEIRDETVNPITEDPLTVTAADVAQSQEFPF